MLAANSMDSASLDEDTATWLVSLYPFCDQPLPSARARALWLSSTLHSQHQPPLDFVVVLVVGLLLTLLPVDVQEQLVAPWRQHEDKDVPPSPAPAETAAVGLIRSMIGSESQEAEDIGVVSLAPPRRHSIVVMSEGRVTLKEQASGGVVTSPLVEYLEHIASPTFDVEALDPFTNAQPLLCVCIHLLNYYNLMEMLELEAPVIQRFFIDVESAYRSVPYHSALHAADVVVTSHRLLRTSVTPVNLSAVELFALLFASASE